MRVVHVVGARPNFIKAAPVYRALENLPGIRQTLVHTGQHYDQNMSEVFFEDLNLTRPDINLEVGSASHSQQTAQIMQRFEPVAERLDPDWVIVYGDVNSTLACTLVCVKMGIKVGHVEAGLRSFDRSMPEEINRVLVDQVAQLHFTPSTDADENLLREGVPRERIHFVGNVMIDTLVELRPRAEARWEKLAAQYDLSTDYIVVTLHRPRNVDQPGRLRTLLGALDEIAAKIKVIFPVHPRTRHRIRSAGLDGFLNEVHLLDPVGYLDFLALQAHARLVVTDSGGSQEETTCLGVPCLTIRPNTERPVTIRQGTNRLFDADSRQLPAAVWQNLEEGTGRSRIPELWDGKAAERIAQILGRGAGTAQGSESGSES